MTLRNMNALHSAMMLALISTMDIPCSGVHRRRDLTGLAERRARRKAERKAKKRNR